MRAKKNAKQSFAKNTRQEAQEQVEASFEDFVQWTKYVTYATIAFLLLMGARNFGVEDESYPAHNGDQNSLSNLNIKD